EEEWDNDDYVCKGLILKGMSDSLFDIYENVESSKELWDSLEAKYMADDASSKKFLKDFKHTLKHKKEELTLVELDSHLRIKECPQGIGFPIKGTRLPLMNSGLKGKPNPGLHRFGVRFTKDVVQQHELELKKSKRNRTPKDFGPEFQLYLIERNKGMRKEINAEMGTLIGKQHCGCWLIYLHVANLLGFKQKSGIDYFDTYAPVARISTIRLLIAMASIHNLIIHQMDVKTAFLNGDLEEEVYMNNLRAYPVCNWKPRLCEMIKYLKD
ncbi:zinc finger, CCHC-type containing protein, partial [Tanacetum coccineum]